MSTCRSCGAEVLWARYSGSERRIPLDPEPRPDGNLTVDDTEPGPPVVTAVRRDAYVSPSAARYVTHFATCPHASAHRKDRS